MKVDLKDLLQTSEESRIAIYKSFGRSVESFQQDLESIRSWLSKCPHLPKNISDTQIESFLVLNKFNVEKSKSKIELYYVIRPFVPQFFEGTFLTSIRAQQAMDNFWSVPMPKMWNALRIFAFKLRNRDPEVLDITGMIINSVRVVDVMLTTDCVKGGVAIIDFEGLTFRHAAKINFLVLRKIYVVMEQVYSGRLYGIHILHPPPVIETIMSSLKLFMKKKYVDRIHLHPSSGSLHNIIPKEYLPTEFGGTERSLEESVALWKIAFREYEPMFQELNRIKVDDSLRPRMVNDDFLGYQGNFRKLDFD